MKKTWTKPAVQELEVAQTERSLGKTGGDLFGTSVAIPGFGTVDIGS